MKGKVIIIDSYREKESKRAGTKKMEKRDTERYRQGKRRRYRKS